MPPSARPGTRPPRAGLRQLALSLPAWLLVVFFALPAAATILHYVRTYVDGTPEVPDGLGAASGAALSPDGAHLYVTGAGDDSLVVFSRNATDDELTFVEVLIDQIGGVFGLDGASGVAVSPDGRNVYTTGAVDDSVAVFARDASEGNLAFVETEEEGVGGVFGLDGASAVAASPDGRHVYAAGALSDALAIFTRDASADDLTFVDAVEDGVGGVAGLGGASAVAVGPDGDFVYAAGADPGSLAVFRARPGGDGLDFVQAFVRGVGYAAGLSGASGVAVSPDGESVYVAGRDEDALVVFRRIRPDEGALAFVGLHRNGVDGVKGMAGPAAVAVSSDGRYVAVAGSRQGAVALFRRHPGTGSLTFLEAHSNAFSGATGLAGVGALALSADRRQLFAAGRDDDALVVFRGLLFEDGFESGDTSRWSAAVPFHSD